MWISGSSDWYLYIIFVFFVFLELFEHIDFFEMFLVQPSDQDLDPEIVGVGDDERREHIQYVRQGSVVADKCGVEVDLGDGAFVLHIYKLARVVRLDFELQTLLELADCVGHEHDFDVLLDHGLQQARIREDAEHLRLKFTCFV